MYEICVQQMRRRHRLAQQGAAPRRLGNSDPGVLQQDVYPARGEDRWVAISVFDAAQKARLDELAGGRPLAEWTREQDERELVERLQAAGIAAGVLQDIEDLMEHDAPLRARGALVDLPHPKLGAFRPCAHADLLLARPATQPYRAPGMGEHNAEIIRGAAGLDAQRLAELESAGVLK